MWASGGVWVVRVVVKGVFSLTQRVAVVPQSSLFAARTVASNKPLGFCCCCLSARVLYRSFVRLFQRAIWLLLPVVTWFDVSWDSLWVGIPTLAGFSVFWPEQRKAAVIMMRRRHVGYKRVYWMSRNGGRDCFYFNYHFKKNISVNRYFLSWVVFFWWIVWTPQSLCL